MKKQKLKELLEQTKVEIADELDSFIEKIDSSTDDPNNFPNIIGNFSYLIITYVYVPIPAVRILQFLIRMRINRSSRDIQHHLNRDFKWQIVDP